MFLPNGALQKKIVNKKYVVGFEVFTAVVLKSIIFWDMTTLRTTRRHIPEDDTLQKRCSSWSGNPPKILNFIVIYIG
jgi:hypothetical protein